MVRLVLPLRILQAVFAILVIGLSGYGVDLSLSLSLSSTSLELN